MLPLQQFSEMWHNENFHIIDTFFRRLTAKLTTRQEKKEEKYSSVCPLCFVYSLVCSCRRTEARSISGKLWRGWIFPRWKLSFRVLIERDERANSASCVHKASSHTVILFSCLPLLCFVSSTHGDLHKHRRNEKYFYSGTNTTRFKYFRGKKSSSSNLLITSVSLYLFWSLVVDRLVTIALVT